MTRSSWHRRALEQLLLLIALAVTSGCYLSHQLGDRPDAGPPRRDLGTPLDLSFPDLGPRIDAGPVAVCMSGETEVQPCGSCGHAMRSCRGDGTWSALGSCSGETDRCGVDLMLLADATGSHADVFRGSEAALTNTLIVPLERDADMRVGVSEFADYGIRPYGLPPPPPFDVPFQGVLAPTHDVAAVGTAISSITFYNGMDIPEAEIAGLDALSGGAPHPMSIPFVCGAGEVPGGCWRAAGAWHVILVMTDAANHSLPDGSGSIVDEYGEFGHLDVRTHEYIGIQNAPIWSTVRAQLIADAAYVYWIVPDGATSLGGGGPSPASRQAREVALELGENPDEAVYTYNATSPDTSLAISAVRMAMTAHFGIHTGP